MSRRIAASTLNASTIDILNTIRANASYEYQSLVPEVTTEHDIPRVGQVLVGYPMLANQFLNALVNRIALVQVKSTIFNNNFAELKKGFLDYGETVEDVFVGIAKARIYSSEKAAAREFQRTIPDVRSAFYAMNWRVQYPQTIEDVNLQTAFTGPEGVQDMITSIIDALYTAAEYDEYLLFKYMLIKAVSHGKMFPVAFDATEPKNAAKKFRGMSNKLVFVSDKYNAAGVQNSTPKDKQYIFMDAEYNAEYDVEVLASAFNMDKADFMGRLKLVDDWASFDMDRFSAILAESDTLEEITDDELAVMANVKAVLVDSDWFQVYDNKNIMTDTYVSSGLYFNYTYHVWKTFAFSPFANAIVFVDDAATVTPPETYTVTVLEKSVDDNVIVFTLGVNDEETVQNSNYQFVQTEDATEDGIAVHRYGAVIMPNDEDSTITLVMQVGDSVYTAGTALTDESDVGDTFTMSLPGE